MLVPRVRRWARNERPVIALNWRGGGASGRGAGGPGAGETVRLIISVQKRTANLVGERGMPDDRNEPRQDAPSAEQELSDLRTASEQLKAKIAAARTRNDMPVDSTLGNPSWDKDAADGHLDIPDDDDDDQPHLPADGTKASSRSVWLAR